MSNPHYCMYSTTKEQTPDGEVIHLTVLRPFASSTPENLDTPSQSNVVFLSNERERGKGLV